MKRLLLWGIALLLTLVAAPGIAQAQRRGGAGTAMTPYGPVYNPVNSPEWRMAGNNPLVYQAMMDQKAAVARQKMMQQQALAAQKQQQAAQKQQIAFEKWVKAQKAKKEKGETVDPAYQRMLDQERQMKAAAEARAARAAARKPRRTTARP